MSGWREVRRTPEGFKPGDFVRVGARGLRAPFDRDNPAHWPLARTLNGRLAKLVCVYERAGIVLSVVQVGEIEFLVRDLEPPQDSPAVAQLKWQAEANALGDEWRLPPAPLNWWQRMTAALFPQKGGRA